LRQRILPKHRTFAREMRGDSTEAENLLWQALRGKRIEGLKFRRQLPLDGYILDFVCFDAKLIVELDGRPAWRVPTRHHSRSTLRGEGVQDAAILERRSRAQPRWSLPGDLE